MIIDNADSMNVFFDFQEDDQGLRPLSYYIPTSGHGSVLITSRNHTGAELSGGVKNTQSIEHFDEATAVQLFLTKFPEPPDETEARELVNLLDNIPLAITQAAAYITANHIRVADYISMYEQSERDEALLLQRPWNDIRRDLDVPNSIVQSWKISYEQIKATFGLAADALAMMSMLDRQGIPEFVAFDNKIAPLERVEAIGVLLQYSLIRKLEGTERLYSLHRLIQVCMRTWLEVDSQLGSWETRAVIAVNKAFNPDHFTSVRSLVPHARRVLQYTLDFDAVRKYNGLLEKVAWLDWDLGNTSAAESALQRVLVWRKANQGGDHMDTLFTLDLIGVLYLNDGRIKEAAATFARVLECSWNKFGAQDIITLTTMTLLGIVYFRQRLFKDAEWSYRQTIDGCEHYEQRYHDESWLRIKLHAQSALAQAYRHQELYRDAETLFKQALGECDRKFSQSDNVTLDVRHGLVELHRSEGRLGEAEVLCKRTQAPRADKFGEHANDTSSATPHLGLIYSDQHRYSEAESILTQAFDHEQKLCGRNHKFSIFMLDDLVELYRRQGRLQEAEPLFKEVLEHSRPTFVRSWPYACFIFYNLVQLYTEQGKHKDADEQLGEVCGLCDIMEGPSELRKNKTIELLELTVDFCCRNGRQDEAQRVRDKIKALKQANKDAAKRVSRSLEVDYDETEGANEGSAGQEAERELDNVASAVAEASWRNRTKKRKPNENSSERKAGRTMTSKQRRRNRMR